MAPKSPTRLAIIPLPKDTVLLPGTTLRIPVPPSRRDIRALIPTITSAEKLRIACVPLNSPHLTRTGQHTIEAAKPDNEEEARASNDIEVPDIDPAKATKDDLFGYGVAVMIKGVVGKAGGNLAFLVEGVCRVSIDKIVSERPFFEADVTYHHDHVFVNDLATQTFFSLLKNHASKEFLNLLRLSSRISPLALQRLELFIAKKSLVDAGVLADFMTNIVGASHEERLQVLAALDVKERLERAIELLMKQTASIKGNFKAISGISTSFLTNIDLNQMKNNFDRDHLKPRLIWGMPSPSSPPPRFSGRSSSRDDDQEPTELDDLKKKLDDAKLSPEAEKVADKELKRLTKMSPAQAEYQVCRNYLETLADIPWLKVTKDRLGRETLSKARKQLDSDHYGLEKVKKRLLEYLAVLKLKQSLNEDVEAQIKQAKEELSAVEKAREDKQSEEDEQSDQNQAGALSGSAKLDLLKNKRMVDKSPILLLVGPPGVGKTSLAKSVATALGRKFLRISLGGVRDEAEIRGHRRTYVAAMPGLIVGGLKKVGVSNPVFLLDEIDKVSTSNFNGDPSAALLEVLDPEQNHTFVDHYVNIPIDLSKVLFIATANSLDTIPAPLLDRMETISLSGYTTLEKRYIAMQHLIPKQVRTNGLGPKQVEFTDDAVSKIIESYTREAGVRNLEREIGSVCRSKAVQYADAKDTNSLEKYKPQLSAEDIEEILGIEQYGEEIAETTSRPGIVTGLVAYSTGGNGSILFIEVASMPGSGSVQLTGKLGDVLKESVEVALSWVKGHAFDLGLTNDPTENIMKNRSIHVHCPSGAIPKDGPSAGMAHTIALISLFSGKAVPPTMAMTGEISLRGKVTAVGGIKEKLIGALRAGVKTVLLPEANRKDTVDLPQEVKDGIEIIHVRHIWEAMKHVWPEAHWPGDRDGFAGIESHL